MTEPTTDAPVLPADANPMTRAADVPPDQWPAADVETIEMLQNTPGVMGARLVASKMSTFLAAGQPIVLSENDQAIVTLAEAANVVVVPPVEDPDMQAPP